jgi:glycosyltransferase involved in cell wall biosynthesis
MTECSGYTRSNTPVAEPKVESANFLYVASGEPHKNHRHIIEAWRLLSEQGIFPTLRLTLDENHFSILCRDIEELCQLHKLRVINMGALLHGDVLALYRKVDVLIYPSSFESFGLPLIEARQAGLPGI